MKTILLTGATGYLGSRLVKASLGLGYKIAAITPNAKDTMAQSEGLSIYHLDEISLKDIFARNEIEGIIHCATCYGRAGENAVDTARVNIMFPLEILSLAVAHKVDFFINTDTILNADINEYALTKNQFRQWLSFYADKIKTVNMRLDHFYGPFDKPNKFIAYLFREFNNQSPFIDLTSGEQTRDFIYIDDVISAYLHIMKNIRTIPNSILNNFEVGSGTQTSIKNLVIMIKELTQNNTTKLNFGAIPYRKNEVLDYKVNISALQKLGWAPKVTLEQGIKQIIKEEKRKQCQ